MLIPKALPRKSARVRTEAGAVCVRHNKAELGQLTGRNGQAMAGVPLCGPWCDSLARVLWGAPAMRFVEPWQATKARRQRQ